MSELKEVKHAMPFGEVLVSSLPTAVQEVVAELNLDTDADGTLSAQELEVDGAMDEIYAALKKLGVSDKSLNLAFGIDTPDARKKKRDERKAKRDAAKSNNGKSQAKANERKPVSK